MKKSNKAETMVKGMVVLAGMLVLFCFFMRMTGGKTEVMNGVPDALSSVVSGGTCRLTVVANTDRIEDKEVFAHKVIQMCRENSFRSLRLSTDIGGRLKELNIMVYYYREDIGSEDPVMRILYKPVTDDEKSSIVDADPQNCILNIE